MSEGKSASEKELTADVDEGGEERKGVDVWIVVELPERRGEQETDAQAAANLRVASLQTFVA